MSTLSVRMKTATIITDPMLVGFAEKKNAAFLEAFDLLTEGGLRLGEIDTEIALFKSRVLKTIEGYQQEEKPLASRVELVGKRARLREEYDEFISIYVKASILSYKTIETINYLKPAYRSFSEEEILKKNAPNLYAQTLELDKNCLAHADKLQGLFTRIIRQKSAVYGLIYDPILMRALEKLDTIIEAREAPSSRASQLFSYISSYVSPPDIEEPPIIPRSRERAALHLLSTDPGPTPKPTPFSKNPLISLPLERMPTLKPSPPQQRRRPSTTLTGSPGSSSGHSPRFLDRPPLQHHRKNSIDSWETISLTSRSGSLTPRPNSTEETSSSPRSYSKQSTTESWENLALTGKAATTLHRSYGQDAGSTSRERRYSPRSEFPGDKTASYYRRERGLAASLDSGSPRERPTSSYRRDLDQSLPRETLVPRSSHLGSERVKLTLSPETPSLHHSQSERISVAPSREIPHSTYSRREKSSPPVAQERFLRQRGLDEQELPRRSLPRNAPRIDANEAPLKRDRSKRLSWKALMPHKKEG